MLLDETNGPDPPQYVIAYKEINDNRDISKNAMRGPFHFALVMKFCGEYWRLIDLPVVV